MQKHLSSGLHMNKSNAKRKAVKICLIITAAVLLVYISVGIKLYFDSKKIRMHEEKALAVLSSADISSPETAISSLPDKLKKAQEESLKADNIANSFIWKIAGCLPFIGGDIKSAQSMTEAVDRVLNDVIPDFSAGGTEIMSIDLNNEQKKADTVLIDSAASKIVSADDKLKQIASDFGKAPDGHFSSVKNAHETCRQKLEELSERVNIYAKAAKALPIILGSDSKQTYVLGAMTPSEARSSGGLIGAVGSISADKGVFKTGDFISDLDLIEDNHGDADGDELRIFNETGPFKYSLDVRDISAYPDTSRVSQALIHVWNNSKYGQQSQADGVILTDPVFLQELISVTGNITMSDGRILTETNTAEFLLNKIYADIPSPKLQDAYFQEAANKIMSKFFANLSSKNIQKILKIFAKSAEERHFSAYSADSTVKDFFDSANIVSSVPNDEENPSVGIYVNQQRASKLDWYLKRNTKIERTSCNQNGSATYHVVYSLQNTITPEEAANGPAYVIGTSNEVYPVGTIAEKILIYPPAGGNISNLKIDKNVELAPQETSMNGKSLWLSAIAINPQETVQYEFDVTVSDKAKSVLTTDQTPAGQFKPETEYDTSKCK